MFFNFKLVTPRQTLLIFQTFIPSYRMIFDPSSNPIHKLSLVSFSNSKATFLGSLKRDMYYIRMLDKRDWIRPFCLSWTDDFFQPSNLFKTFSNAGDQNSYDGQSIYHSTLDTNYLFQPFLFKNFSNICDIFI